MSTRSPAGPGPSRRAVIGGLAAGVAAGVVGLQAARHYAQPAARVTVLRHRDYDDDLAAHLQQGLERWPALLARVKGGRVVLKPNFVEYHPPRPINTDVRFVAATIEAFHRLGAAEVLVGEGPGHMRDTEYLLESTGLDRLLVDTRARFVDLNVDDTKRVTLPRDKTKFGSLHLARTAVTADVLVSLAKMKTHHWAGATLTMKNLFGIVPSAVYGWPKNPLHYAGIQQSVFDIWDAVRPHFGIVDGIVGMEGDGPIMGTPKPFGAIIMGDNLPAVDAHTARLMGLAPELIAYLWVARAYGGTIAEARIAIEGDAIAPDDFALLPYLEPLRGR